MGYMSLNPATEREWYERVPHGLDFLVATREEIVTKSNGQIVGKLVEVNSLQLTGRAVDEDGEIINKFGNVPGCAGR